MNSIGFWERIKGYLPKYPGPSKNIFQQRAREVME
jgi:hypothetical protein